MFSRHLKDTNKSYIQHMIGSLKYSLKLYIACQILLVHAVFPFVFETTATDILKDILKETKK